MLKKSTISTSTAAIIATTFGGAALADPCPGQMFVAKNETAPPTSVSASDIATFVAAAPWAEGVRVTAEERDAELWVDVTEFPGNTTAAAAPRTAWLVGRIMDTDATTVVFFDADQALFQIEARALKDIGCRFVVGEEAGENPIALMREFYDAVTRYGSGERIAPRFTGSLLGDTTTAMTANNEVFVPEWILSAVK
ncbi:hypothetical protein M3484_22455 [Pseudomonas sp. GX19020]|uniref:hypothetical protein n=1 Tax=Pseudomonas sp. GX19020 TaxID=2942277 RepID=UPI002018D7EE|nr:hypothetical protein [Pseudomonas sp. GX19020]MCL4069324.1 hypothetical protein [Pseudomonas sp. GX19020]